MGFNSWLIGAWLLAAPYSAPDAALTATYAQTITVPYTFEELDYNKDAEPPITLPVVLSSPEFINEFGSIAVTVWALLDEFGALGYIVIILLAVMVIRGIARFVTNKPAATEAVDISAGLSAAEVATGDENYGRARKIYRKSKRFF